MFQVFRKELNWGGRRLVLYESVLTTGGPRYQSRLTLDLTN